MVEQEVLVEDHEVLVELQEKNPIWPPVTGPAPGLAFKGLSTLACKMSRLILQLVV